MIINGIGRTTDGFESLSIPLAIVSASFVTVVEFAGSVLLILGALTPLVSALMLVIMGGAAIFVHIPNGIFVANGGWELVGVIAAGMIALAATGPGRYSVDHLVSMRQEQYRREMAVARSGLRPAHARGRSAIVPAARAPQAPVTFREPVFQAAAPGSPQPMPLPFRTAQPASAFRSVRPFEASGALEATGAFEATGAIQQQLPTGLPEHAPAPREATQSAQEPSSVQEAAPLFQEAAPMFQEGRKLVEPTAYQQPAPALEEPAPHRA